MEKTSVRRKSEPGEATEKGVREGPRGRRGGGGSPSKTPRLARSVKFLGPPCLVVFTLLGVLVEHQAVVAGTRNLSRVVKGQVRSCGYGIVSRELRSGKFVLAEWPVKMITLP